MLLYNEQLSEEKQRIREKIWRLMRERNLAIFPLPCYGRIPNFLGSDKAATKVSQLEEWKKARVIVANPDFAQQKVREIALKEGKTLIMASPRLRYGYIKIDPQKIKGKETLASTIKGAFRYGEKVAELSRPDLIITGCVAVTPNGYRLGKGRAYGDREIRMVKSEFGEIPVITTVNDVQIIDSVPIEEHDEKVDIIVTPTRVIRVK